MPQSQPHSIMATKMATGFRSSPRPRTYGVTTSAEIATRPTKIAGAANACGTLSKVCKPTIASMAVLVMAPT